MIYSKGGRHRTKPSGALSIDWGHPLSVGLIHAVVPSTTCGYDLCTRKPGQLGTLAKWTGGTMEGPGPESVSQTNGHILWPGGERVYLLQQNYTIYVRMNVVALGGAGDTIFSLPYREAGWAAPFFSLGFERVGASTLQHNYASTGPVLTSTNSDAGIFNAGLSGFGLTREGSSLRFFLNGPQFGTTKVIAPNTDIVFSGERRPVNWFNRSDSATGEGVIGVLLCGYLWNRTLSLREMAWLNAFPYDFIVPIPAHRYGLISLPVLTGQCFLGKPIDLRVTWAPETAGSAATLKQFPGFQITPENNDARHNRMGFLADHQLKFAYIDNNRLVRTRGWGIGKWGLFPWGDVKQLRSSALRTHVPQDHQRARSLATSYQNNVAKEAVNIVEAAWDVRAHGTRTQKLPEG